MTPVLVMLYCAGPDVDSYSGVPDLSFIEAMQVMLYHAGSDVDC